MFYCCVCVLRYALTQSTPSLALTPNLLLPHATLMTSLVGGQTRELKDRGLCTAFKTSVLSTQNATWLLMLDPLDCPIALSLSALTVHDSSHTVVHCPACVHTHSSPIAFTRRHAHILDK